MFTKNLAIGIICMLVISCTDQDKQIVKKEIDSAVNNVQSEIDTMIINVALKDSMFDNARKVKTDTSRLAPAEDRKKFNELFEAYLDIKEDLAERDTSDAKKNSKEFLSKIAETQFDLKSTVDSKWQLTPIKLDKLIKQIETANSINSQTLLFSELSSVLIDFIEANGLYDKTVYVLSCSNTYPEGGKWLEDSKDLQNPYKGGKDKSLSHVTVEKEIIFE